MSLKTDYKDDILAVGNLRKYQMIQNNDGTVSFQDVTQYEQTGDVFGAGDINRTNQAVNEKFDSGDVVDPMLTTEPGFAADAYQTKLQFDEQNKKLGKTTYSTEETEIGTWIDGKTIYRRIYVFDNNPTSFDIGFDANTVDAVVKLSGSSNHANGNACEVNNYYYDKDCGALTLQRSANQINTNISGWSITKLYIIFEYTKK